METYLFLCIMWWIIFFVCIIIPFAIGGLSLAPFVPTFSSDVQRLKEILPRKKGARFLEVWCGNGKVSAYVAAEYPEYHVTGIEIAFPVYCIAKIRQFLSKGNLKIQLKNALKEDFGKYDVIYIFGMPEHLEHKILPKFENEMQAGSMLISYTFSLSEKFKGERKSYTLPNRNAFHVVKK